MGVEEWTKIPVARTSWAFVQDFHHDSSIISYPPQAIAIAAIELAMSAFGCTVPLCTPEGRNSWQSVSICVTCGHLMICGLLIPVLVSYLQIFYSKFSRTEHLEIMMKILHLYEREFNILRQSLFEVSMKDMK
jgi:hypothetical protein